MARRRTALVVPDGPPGFEVNRSAGPGRHPILEVFPGMDRLETARRIEPEAGGRARLFASTRVEVVTSDVWMYVAPWEVPPGARREWRPVMAPGEDVIVVGRGHLADSPTFTLFLDIFHELRHVQQRHAGRQLFDRTVSYVQRPTEVEAYQFVVDEARRFGVTDGYLRDYLRVEWISDAEHRELLATLGVPAN